MNNNQLWQGQRKTNFYEVWKKSIEKYSPKKSSKLNEVSYRFQMKLDEAQKVAAKREGKSTSTAPQAQARLGQGPMLLNDEEQERIKFVSMIDQKPIKPSYLELIPLRHFAKKETELTRKQTKELTKPESSEKQTAYTDVKQLFKVLREDIKQKYNKHEKELDDHRKQKKDKLESEYRKRIRQEELKTEGPVKQEQRDKFY